MQPSGATLRTGLRRLDLLEKNPDIEVGAYCNYSIMITHCTGWFCVNVTQAGVITEKGGT